MGTIKKGILGGFSGKVGNVIGSSWKGISYMRSMPQNVTQTRSAAQSAQKERFAHEFHNKVHLPHQELPVPYLLDNSLVLLILATSSPQIYPIALFH